MIKCMAHKSTHPTPIALKTHRSSLPEDCFWTVGFRTIQGAAVKAWSKVPTHWESSSIQAVLYICNTAVHNAGNPRFAGIKGSRNWESHREWSGIVEIKKLHITGDPRATGHSRHLNKVGRAWIQIGEGNKLVVGTGYVSKKSLLKRIETSGLIQWSTTVGVLDYMYTLYTSSNVDLFVAL